MIKAGSGSLPTFIMPAEEKKTCLIRKNVPGVPLCTLEKKKFPKGGSVNIGTSRVLKN
jgi:hypothetical protein